MEASSRLFAKGNVKVLLHYQGYLQLWLGVGQGKFLPAGAGQRMASSLLLNLNLNPTNANKHFKAQDAKSVQSKDV